MPQYRTICQLNGINLNNGTTTFVMPGADLGTDGVEYDTIRHYDGSLLQHDVRGALSTMTIPVKLVFESPAALGAMVDAIRASVRGGGSFTWADGGESQGPVESFMLAEESGPEAPRDFLYRKRGMAIYDVKMTRFPRA